MDAAVPPTGPLRGRTLELEVGGPAHGGYCVARREGRVVFVRHALPGERVRALVTEDRGGAFCFADAVEVLIPSADRVEPPCPHAGPGRCGGCDWQHASGPAQRELKATVVREQFTRLAGIDVGDLFTGVEPLPGGLLGWRTRNQYAVDGAGRAGFRRHRSHEVERLDRCPLGAAGVGDGAQLTRSWPGLSGVELARGTAAEDDVEAPAEDDVEGSAGLRIGAGVATLGHRPGRGPRARRGRGRRPPDRVDLLDGPAELTHRIGERTFRVRAGGFWQVHPDAAHTFADAVLRRTDPRPGDRVLELYCGAGSLTAGLAERVGPGGEVVAVDASVDAIDDARNNLADLPQVRLHAERVDPALIERLGSGADVVVLDPPRTGAGRAVVTALLELAPRAIGYVACDPAALARDVAVATAAGWHLAALLGFDAFPMTHHVECVALLRPPT